MVQPAVPNKNERIGWAGLGVLGQPMATQLVKWAKAEQLPPVTVWNRTASKAEEFRAQGCKVAGDLQGLAKDCDIVIASLANDAAAIAVFKELFAVTSDVSKRNHPLILVNTSTISWDLSVELERQARNAGHHYLACPVFGPPPLARASQLIIVLSGDTESRRYVEPYLVPSIGRKTIDVGNEVDKALKLKLLGNSMVLGTLELLGEGMTLADKSGVGANALYSFVQDFFPAPSWVGYGKKIVDDAFTEDIMITLDNGIKDAKLMRRLGEENSCPLPVVEVAHQHMLMARSLAGGEVDWMSCVGGQRISAGCHPFKRQQTLKQYFDEVSK